MTNFQGKTWMQYRKECKATGVEPVRADWLGIQFTDEELDARIMRGARKRQPNTMAATAGR